MKMYLMKVNESFITCTIVLYHGVCTHSYLIKLKVVLPG